MEKQIIQVRAFQNAFNVPMPTKPTLLKPKRKELRQNILEEEVKELRDAKTIVQTADALIDILYVAIGTIHEYGLADRAILLFDEVHRSNMSKVPLPGQKPIIREDGKVMKPDTYSPPKLGFIIDRDFEVYRSSKVLKELAEQEAKETEAIIRNSMLMRLNFFDRMLFRLHEALESNLKKKVSTSNRAGVDGFITINVYGKTYEIK